MSNCAVMQPMGMAQRVRNNLMAATPVKNTNITTTTTTTTTTASERSGSAGSNKENGESGGGRNWLSKVCRKLRSKHKRQERCEKCGQRSDTCLPNASFISGRKHYLCQDCRASSHNMKNMYSQLCRNLSLRETRSNAPHHSGEATANQISTSSSSSSSRTAVVMRSRSMRARPTAPESGYETATSLDSSCSNGRLSPEAMSTSSGECGGRCTPHEHYSSPRSAYYPSAEHSSPSPLHPCVHENVVMSSSKDRAAGSRDKAEVFGGAFKSEKDHLQQLQTRPQQKVYTRQQQHQPAHPAPHRHQEKQHKKTPRYDGYLEIRAPNAEGVKYVFRRQEEDLEDLNDEVQEDHLARRRHTENLKQCYRCQKYRCVAFRAPFQKGWLCEDCMDDLL